MNTIMDILTKYQTTQIIAWGIGIILLFFIFRTIPKKEN